jgi:hypothetical protein
MTGLQIIILLLLSVVLIKVIIHFGLLTVAFDQIIILLTGFFKYLIYVSNTPLFTYLTNFCLLVNMRGPRVALRGKVSDTLATGLTGVDSLLPIGRGQRQLVLGDRLTGKTSIFISAVLLNNYNNLLGSIDGFGAKRLFSLYIGVCQNLSKLYKLYYLVKDFGVL